MKFKINKTKEAQKEFKKLPDEQKIILEKDYKIIETKGISYVNTRPLGQGIFEIKTKNLRSLFKYKNEQIIIIGVIYQKQSQKAPKHIIELAGARLKEI
jgi:phage-related protein